MSKWLSLGNCQSRSPKSSGSCSTFAAKSGGPTTAVEKLLRKPIALEKELENAAHCHHQQQHQESKVKVSPRNKTATANNSNTKIGEGGVHATQAECHGGPERCTEGSDCCFEDDWEVVEAEADGGVGAGVEETESERRADPVSPGVEVFARRRSSIDSKGSRKELEICEDSADRKWMDAGKSHSFLVRGATYLMDKGKQPAGAAMCRLVGFDCFSEGSFSGRHNEGSGSVTTRLDHIASRGRCRERVEAMTRGDNAPFLFIMNIQVRGTPPISLVAYWAVNGESFDKASRSVHGDAATDAADAAYDGSGDDDGTRTAAVSGSWDGDGDGDAVEGSSPSQQEQAFTRIVASYANLPLSSFGGDSCSMMDEAPPPPYSDERNTRFKLIPRVIGGPWVVRKAVGTTPVLLGTKINHRYYRGKRYIETDMDTGSSVAAASLCGRCRGLSRKLDVELGIVLQANLLLELPEALLGAVRLNGFGVEDPGLQTELFPSSHWQDSKNLP